MIESVESITYNGVELVDILREVNNEYGTKEHDNYMVINEVRGRSVPDFEVTTIEVPAAREYETTRRVATRHIEVDLSIKAQSFEILRESIERLSHQLTKDVDKEDVPITFADEPERTYYGKFVGSDENMEDSMIAKITIFIDCYDPYKYGDEQTYDIEESQVIHNHGYSSTYPVFDLEVEDETTLLSIGNTTVEDGHGNHKVILLGEDVDVDEDVQDETKLVLHDTMESTDGWLGASNVDSGEVTGTMGVDEVGFYVEDWGQEEAEREKALEEIEKDILDRKNKYYRDIKDRNKELGQLKGKKNPTKKDKERIKELNKEIKELRKFQRELNDERRERRKKVMAGEAKWIGPSLKREFDEPLNSFVADIRMENRNYKDANGDLIQNGVGIVEVYFRDANDNMVCKMQFGDASDVEPLNRGIFATGVNRGEVTTPIKRFPIEAPNPTGFNNFNGELRVDRDTDYFYPKLTKVNKNGIRMKWFTTNPKEIIPGGQSVGSNPVTSIQVAIRKWVGAKRIYARIKEIKVYSKIGWLEFPDTKPVHKFNPGDRIHIDTKEGLILVNDEERIDLLHIDSNLFELKPGANVLDIDTEKLTGTVSFKERFL